MCVLFLCSFSVLWILPAMMQALLSGAEILRAPTAYFLSVGVGSIWILRGTKFPELVTEIH